MRIKIIPVLLCFLIFIRFTGQHYCLTNKWFFYYPNAFCWIMMFSAILLATTVYKVSNKIIIAGKIGLAIAIYNFVDMLFYGNDHYIIPDVNDFFKADAAGWVLCMASMALITIKRKNFEHVWVSIMSIVLTIGNLVDEFAGVPTEFELFEYVLLFGTMFGMCIHQCVRPFKIEKEKFRIDVQRMYDSIGNNVASSLDESRIKTKGVQIDPRVFGKIKHRLGRIRYTYHRRSKRYAHHQTI